MRRKLISGILAFAMILQAAPAALAETTDEQALAVSETIEESEETDADSQFLEDDTMEFEPAEQVSENEAKPAPEEEKETEAESTEEEQTATYEASEEETAMMETLSETEEYLKEQTGNDKDPVVVNFLRVKHSLFDGEKTGPDETIDSIMNTPEAAEKFVCTFETQVALYEFNEDDEYFVALADTMLQDENVTVQDYIFAEDNTQGILLDGCKYDAETGIAYIPKADFFDENGGYRVQYAQLQLMQIIPSFAHDQYSVFSLQTSGALEEGNTIIAKDIYDVETIVNLKDYAEKLPSVKDLSVSVNGIEIPDTAYHYNEETGDIAFDLSPAGITRISISAGKKSAAESIASSILGLLKPMNVFADDAGNMGWANSTPIRLPSTITSGYQRTVDVPTYYHYDWSGFVYSGDAYGNGGGYGAIGGDLVGQISSGSFSNWYMRETSSFGALTNFEVAINQIRFEENGQMVDFGPIGRSYWISCTHAGSPAGGDSQGANSWKTRRAYVRFLNVNFGAGYAIVGIMTPTLTYSGQAGAGIIKIRIEQASVNVNIHKSSSAPSVNNGNSNYSLAGAEYKIYSDSACTRAVATLVTNSSGYTPSAQIAPGTYYVKETKAPKGFKLNTGVTAINPGGGDYTAEVSDAPYPHGNIKVIKQDTVFETKLKDAVFRLYKWNGSSFVSLGNLKNNGNGTYTSSELYADIKNPTGRFKIEEITVPKYHTGSYVKEFTLPATPGTITFTANNAPQPVEVRLKKVNVEKQSEQLSGATFDIYEGPAYTRRVATMTWNASKQVYTATLTSTTANRGWFKVVERTAPPEYKGTFSKEFMLKTPADGSIYSKDGTTLYYTIGTATNEPLREYGQVVLKKVSEEDTSKTLSDGIFYVYQYDVATGAYQNSPFCQLVYNSSTKCMETTTRLTRYDQVTDRGMIKDGRTVVQNDGKFKVVEIQPPAGYISQGFEAEFEVLGNKAYETPQIFSYTSPAVTNKPNEVKLAKVNEAGDPLTGVTYHIWSSNGYDVTKSTTDGEIVLKALVPGTYQYQETATLAHYKLNNAVRSFKVAKTGLINGTEESVTYTDTNYHEQELVVEKTDLITGLDHGDAVEPTSGIPNNEVFPNGTMFKVLEYSESLGDYKAQSYVNIVYEGTQFVDIKTGSRPLLVRTPDNNGQFRIIETRATDGYILDPTPKDITVPITPSSGDDSQHVPFENDINHITIHKTGSGKALPGAQFRIWCEKDPGHTAILVTDTNAEITINRLRPGVWFYQETRAPEGFIPDDNVYSFKVAADGRLPNRLTYQEFTVDNEKETMIEIVKLDAETHQDYYPNTDFPAGTEFEIYEWNKEKGAYETEPSKNVIYNRQNS